MRIFKLYNMGMFILCMHVTVSVEIGNYVYTYKQKHLGCKKSTRPRRTSSDIK